METTNNDQNCEHVWKYSGLWDGWDGTGERRKNTGGPMGMCINCSEKKNFTWAEWKTMPSEKIIPPFSNNKDEDAPSEDLS